MNGEDRKKTMWKALKQRLGFTGLPCCGSTWNLRGEAEAAQLISEGEPVIVARRQGSTNLAAALAAERRFRSVGGTSQLKTLMSLFEETDGRDEKSSLMCYSTREGGGVGGMCCVCMERSKGAAFIPCGHTYCRVCSRELWLNRGLCPLCNSSISEILDIF